MNEENSGTANRRGAARSTELGSEGAGRLAKVLEIVREVRHDINSSLTAIMAEAEFLLMDDDRLTADQKRSLETIGEMARRIRDLVTKLKGIDAVE